MKINTNQKYIFDKIKEDAEKKWYNATKNDIQALCTGTLLCIR